MFRSTGIGFRPSGILGAAAIAVCVAFDGVDEYVALLIPWAKQPLVPLKTPTRMTVKGRKKSLFSR